jgi:hypothetical protein
MSRGVRAEHVPEIHFLHLRVALDTTSPVWRRLRVSNTLTFRALHGVLQVAIGWSNRRGHEFRVGDRTYGATGGAARDERRVRLGTLVGPGDVFHYVYGRDDGRHVIEVERWAGIHPDDPRLLCLGGAGACPLDDGDVAAFDLAAVNAVLVAMCEPRPARLH